MFEAEDMRRSRRSIQPLAPARDQELPLKKG